MQCIQEVKDSLISTITTLFGLESAQLGAIKVDLNVDPLKQKFGDLTSNAPLILAKILHKSPHQVAQEIVGKFSHPFVARTEAAGAGFLNIFLNDTAFIQSAQELFSSREKCFKPATLAKEKYNIEFVSANPTGPLHFGHGRGGIVGDVLANVLQFLGHTVTREFYINDAGSQMKKLATSLIIRCQQTLGIDAQLPEDSYHGAYMQELAQKCIAEFGPSVLERSELFFEEYAREYLLKNIRTTLTNYGINYDVWFSEQQLHKDGCINQAVELLKRKGLLYEQESALWFKSTDFGDDKDRVVRKTTGEWTYVAADIAYLKNKVDRGFSKLIFILGHDHHSYAVRLHGIKSALELKATLDIILYQLVKLKQGEHEIRMSKRTGNIITLDDIISEVGTDVARFFYLYRKADAQLEFDLDLALKKTEENPVYYIQYAYVRTKSILSKMVDVPALQGINAEDATHLSHEEQLCLKKILALQSLLQTIQGNFQTHLLAYFSIELANIFHGYYAHNRIIDPENIAKSRARLLLVMILRNTFATLFDLLGISKPEKM